LIYRLFLPVILNEGIGGLLISQSGGDAGEHFQIVHRAFEHFAKTNPRDTDEKANAFNKSLKANLLHTKFRNKGELYFDILDSRVRIASAEKEEAGQGITLHHVVASEVARWPGNPEATISNIKGAIVPGGTFDEESTCNGAAGYYYEQCLRCLNDPANADAKLHYHDWFWIDEYTVDPKLTDKEKEELEKDLTSEELAVIKKMNLELKEVAWTTPTLVPGYSDTKQTQDLPHDVIWHYLDRIAWRRATMLEQRANFQEKYPEDVLTAFLVTGKSYFDREILRIRKMELVTFKPFQVVSNGEGRLFHPRIPGRRYVIGADPATGRQVTSEKIDNSAAVVLDLETGEEMAAYRAIIRPEEFALDLAALGVYYNNATIAVERTGDGGTVIVTLANECKYPAIYKHKDWMKRERKMVELEGFPTTPRTRPLACNFVAQFISESPELIWDVQFIDEALVFVRNEKGKPEAAPGAHDDTVSARWIAHGARRLLLGWWLPHIGKNEGYISADRVVGESSQGTVSVG
jgi:hypothetical protein